MTGVLRLSRLPGRAAALGLLWVAALAACGQPPPEETGSTAPGGSSPPFVDGGPAADAGPQPLDAGPTPAPTDAGVDAGGPPAFDAARAARLKAALDAVRQQLGAPGAQAAASYLGGARWSAGSGAERVQGGALVSSATRFRVASVTKMFTAAVALQLVEEGKLSLDDPLGKHLTSYPNAAKVTLRQLLSHRSGVPNYTAGGFSCTTRVWTPEQLVALVSGKPLGFTPGTRYEYSDTNFILVGLVVEKAGGERWSAQVRKRLLDPLGLADTYVDGDEAVPPPMSGGHDLGGASPKDVTGACHPSAAWAAGSIVSTATDLTRWLEALFSGKVLGAAMLKEMKTAHSTLPSGPFTGYGYGLFIGKTDTHVWYGHNGVYPGYQANARYYEDGRWSVAGLINLNGPQTGNRLGDAVAGQMLAP